MLALLFSGVGMGGGDSGATPTSTYVQPIGRHYGLIQPNADAAGGLPQHGR